MKRLFAVILSLLLLLGVAGTCVIPAAAANKETILIAGSDFQTDGNKTTNVDKVINTLQANGFTKVDGAFFCGDYNLDKRETNKSQYGIQKLKDTFAPLAGENMLFVQGNHDPATTTGLSRAGDNDPSNRAYGAYIITLEQYAEWGEYREKTAEMVKDLRSYLEQKRRQGFKKPVFILCHIPLHWSNRTYKDGSGTQADLIFDALNEYGEKGLNIIYLYGHNHSEGYDDAMGGGAVYFKKGDSINVCQGGDESIKPEERKKHYKACTLHFTYMNAGFIGNYSTDEKLADTAVTMSVFRIQPDDSVIITRYDGIGVHNLKSAGVWNAAWTEAHYNTPNTLVYSSSRRVTATEDTQVDTPPPPVYDTTTADTYTTTTQNGGVVINKHPGTTEVGDTPTTAQDATATVADETAATTAAEKDTAQDKDTAPKDTATAPLIPWWAWLGMSVVAVLLIGAVVAIVLLSRPIKP